MTPPITIVERTARVGVLGHLDELERLMREYCDSYDGDERDLQRRLTLSGFIAWIRHQQTQRRRLQLNPDWWAQQR